MAHVEELNYNDLIAFSNGQLSLEKRQALLDQISRAYGVGGLGVLTVSAVPGYGPLRKNLLKLSQKFAVLPESAKSKVKDPLSNYQLGWSHGIEILEGGKPDIYKGSYYANPNYNVPTTDQKAIKTYPSYARPNIWPKEDLPELEEAFMKLGQLVTTVGVKLGKVCDVYTKSKGAPSPELETMIKESISNKARLLHYFPVDSSFEMDDNNWCGVHCDHGALTGLCRAIYINDKTGEEVETKDKTSGLYIIKDNGERVKIVIPENNIAFQLGQAAQICSSGFLRATPHLVKAGRDGDNVSRNTFAVFLQPHWKYRLRSSVSPDTFGISKDVYQEDINFGQFSENMIKYYHAKL